MMKLVNCFLLFSLTMCCIFLGTRLESIILVSALFICLQISYIDGEK
jgi:hypothetical protein